MTGLISLTMTSGCGLRSSNGYIGQPGVAPTTVPDQSVAERLGPNLPTLPSNGSVLSGLGPEQAAGMFALRIPNDMDEDPPTTQNGMTTYKWWTKSHTGPYSGFIIARTYYYPRPSVSLTTAEQFMKDSAESFYNDNDGEAYLNLVATPMRYGKLNDLIVGYSYFKAQTRGDDGNLYPLHGLVYEFRSERARAFIYAQDFEPQSSTTIPQFEAACRSMRDIGK